MLRCRDREARERVEDVEIKIDQLAVEVQRIERELIQFERQISDILERLRKLESFYRYRYTGVRNG